MSKIINIGGGVSDTESLHKAYSDDEWKKHYTKFNQLKRMQETLIQFSLDEYEAMEKREEELGLPVRERKGEN
jgi:hypothetical protein